MALALDIGEARFALGIQRVKGLLEPFLRRLSRINGAPHARHTFSLPFDTRPRPLREGVTPKNSGPDQRVPVMRRAISDRLR